VNLLEEAMTPVIWVSQDTGPLGSGAVEHELHIVPGLGELLRGHHGVDDPGQVPVRLGVREHDDRCLGHDRFPLDVWRLVRPSRPTDLLSVIAHTLPRSMRGGAAVALALIRASTRGAASLVAGSPLIRARSLRQ